MRFLKFLAASCALFGLLSAIVYLERCRLAESALTLALQRAGLTPTAIVIKNIGPRGLTIDTLTLTRQAPEGPTTISARGLSLHYQIKELLGGTLADADLERLEISTPPAPAPTPASEAATRFTLPALPADIVIPIIPIKSLTIHQALLQNESLGVLNGRPFFLRATADEKQIRVTLARADNDPATPRLLLEVLPPKRLTLKLGREKDVPVLQAGMSLNSGEITGVFSLDLKDLLRLAADTELMAPDRPQNWAGKMTGNFSYNFSTPGKAEFSLRLAGKDALFDETCLDTASLLLRGRLAQIDPDRLSLETQPDCALSAHGLRNRDLAAGRIHLALGGRGLLGPDLLEWRPDPLGNLAAEDLRFQDSHLANLVIKPALAVAASASGANLTLEPDFAVMVGDFEIRNTTNIKNITNPESAGANDTAPPALVLSPVQASRVQTTLRPDAPPTWSVGPGQWLLTPAPARHAELRLTPGPLTLNFEQLQGSGARWNLRADLSTQSLLVEQEQLLLELRDIELVLSGDESALQGDLSLLPQALRERLALRFSHSLRDGAGRAELRPISPLSLDKNGTRFKELFTQPITVPKTTSGSLDFTAAASWNAGEPPRASLRGALTNASGSLAETVFTGLDVHYDLQLSPAVGTLSPLSLSVEEINAGVPVKDITARLNIKKQEEAGFPPLELLELKAAIFGGSLRVEQAVYDHAAASNTFQVKAQGIDLAAIAATQNQQGALELSGKLDGLLPLTIDAQGVSVTGGEFYNQPPGGVIRYDQGSGGIGGGSGLTQIVQRALEEFHYDILRATADYKPSGELTVNMHLEGKSPKLDTTRPVHLNINTEQNILSLLKSLRYSEAMTEKLDQKVQQRFKADN